MAMKAKSLTQLVVLDVVGSFPGNRNKLRITQTTVSYLKLVDMMRMSSTCKRLYIILGDYKILKRFQEKNQGKSLSEIVMDSTKDKRHNSFGSLPPIDVRNGTLLKYAIAESPGMRNRDAQQTAIESINHAMTADEFLFVP